MTSTPQFPLIVSPLVTLAFELCVVGETGLKTGWVRCRHVAGRGGLGQGGVGVSWYIFLPYTLGNSVFVACFCGRFIQGFFQIVCVFVHVL